MSTSETINIFNLSSNLLYNGGWQGIAEVDDNVVLRTAMFSRLMFY